jgi:hypothetical protein
MLREFETQRFDLVKGDRVRVTDYPFGHNKHGELDVWIESSDRGKRFMSQLVYQGGTYAVRTEIYTKECYILRGKATGRYWFLDMNDCGFWLHSDAFSGAETFSGDEAVKIQKWLAEAPQPVA